MMKGIDEMSRKKIGLVKLRLNIGVATEHEMIGKREWHSRNCFSRRVGRATNE